MELLTREEGGLAVRLARTSLERAVRGERTPSPAVTPVFKEKRGVFVTLSAMGTLRGCIGFPEPVLPLHEAIEEAAEAAALEDPRFTPVRPDELRAITVEVTVLTVPELLEGDPLDRPARVVVGKHGLIVRGRGRSGLLLPQVATEYNWESREFLEHTCMKAGLSRACWKDSDVRFLTFEGQIFHEPD